jgi:hypothetical protein
MSKTDTDKATKAAAMRYAGVDYRLERWKGRRARRRAARALKSLDRALVRLAKQTDLTIKWKRHAAEAHAHQGALADQPTSLVLHIVRKVGVTLAECGLTYSALQLAGIPGRNLRLMLAIALAGLLVLLGQTIARTMKRAHLASETSDGELNELKVERPSKWDWSMALVSLLFLGLFAWALTALRDSYNHALAQAQANAAAADQSHLAVAAPVHAAPGWVIAILALVAPLIAILTEYAQYHPHAHRLRRSLRLYAWNTRKLRYVLRRCARPVHRGRRALLAFDSLRSRALRMKRVIHAKYGGSAPTEDRAHVDADEPVRQLRARLERYDATAERARSALLESQDNEPTIEDELGLRTIEPSSPNGKQKSKAALS